MLTPPAAMCIASKRRNIMIKCSEADDFLLRYYILFVYRLFLMLFKSFYDNIFNYPLS